MDLFEFADVIGAKVVIERMPNVAGRKPNFRCCLTHPVSGYSACVKPHKGDPLERGAGGEGSSAQAAMHEHAYKIQGQIIILPSVNDRKEYNAPSILTAPSKI